MIKTACSLLLVLLACAANQAVAGSTLRCGSALISTGDPAVEVARKCGEPASRAFIGYVEAPSYGGRYNQVPIEEWLYGPSNGMYQYLRFEGSRLVEIRSKRGD